MPHMPMHWQACTRNAAFRAIVVIIQHMQKVRGAELPGGTIKINIYQLLLDFRQRSRKLKNSMVHPVLQSDCSASGTAACTH